MSDLIPKLKEEIAPIVQKAQAFEVTNVLQRNSALECAKDIVGAIKKVHEVCDPVCDATNKAHKVATAQRKGFLTPLEEAKTIMKEVIGNFDEQEERERIEKQRILQAEADERARKEREKIEQAEAAQRAIEEAARKKEQEARDAAAAAENEADRKRLEKEAAAAERKAEAAAAKAEEKAEEAAYVEAPVIQITAPEKTKGASRRKTYEAVLVDMDLLLKTALGDGPDSKNARSLILFDQKKANKLANATTGEFECAGIQVKEGKSIMSIRGRQ